MNAGNRKIQFSLKSKEFNYYSMIEVDIIALIASMITGLATLIVAIVLFKELKTTKKSQEADLLERLYKDFFFNKSNREIIKRIEHNENIIDDKEISLTSLDDFLGIIGMLSRFIDNKLLSKDLVGEIFGYYIVKCCDNKEILNHIKSEQKRPPKYHAGILKIRDEFRSYI